MYDNLRYYDHIILYKIIIGTNEREIVIFYIKLCNCIILLIAFFY